MSSTSGAKFFQAGHKFWSWRFRADQASSTAKHWMEHHPVLANSILCANLWIVGDSLAQYAEHRSIRQMEHPHRQKETAENPTILTNQHGHNKNDNNTAESHVPWKMNVLRTAECASCGALFDGPLSALWYPFLESVCARWRLAARYGVWAAPVAKVIADEFVLDPPCLLIFFGYMNVCEGGSWESFQQKLQHEFWRTWMTSLAIWPMVGLVTFRYVPVYAQAPILNTCCIVWDAFLSHRNAVSARIQEQTGETSKHPGTHATITENDIKLEELEMETTAGC